MQNLLLTDHRPEVPHNYQTSGTAFTLLRDISLIYVTLGGVSLGYLPSLPLITESELKRLFWTKGKAAARGGLRAQRFQIARHIAGKAARIIFNSCALSAGFWRKPVAPALRVPSSLDSGSRPVKTITGTCDRVSLLPSRVRVLKPSPAGSPRSRMIRSGRSFCATEMAE